MVSSSQDFLPFPSLNLNLVCETYVPPAGSHVHDEIENCEKHVPSVHATYQGR